MKVVLTAVPGAGKSTIIKKIKELRPDIETVNFGDMMFEVAANEYGVTDRDLMRSKLSPEDYRRVQELAAKRISEMEGEIIIDTHCSILTPRGYYPGLTEEVAKYLGPDVIVLLEYNPDEIAKRRRKDIGSSERTGRDVEQGQAIELHQQMNRSFATAYAALSRSSVRIISLRQKERHEFEHAETAAKRIIELLRQP